MIVTYALKVALSMKQIAIRIAIKIALDPRIWMIVMFALKGIRSMRKIVIKIARGFALGMGFMITARSATDIISLVKI
jgi:hypothetical protein